MAPSTVLWRNLFADFEPIGQTIRIRNVPCTVVGVLEPTGQNVVGQDQDDAVLIPLSTAKRRGFSASSGRTFAQSCRCPCEFAPRRS